MNLIEKQETRNCERHGEYREHLHAFMSDGKEGTWWQSGCPICNEERCKKERQREEELENSKRMERIAENRKAAAIPRRFARCTFDNFAATLAGQQQALSVARGFAENFPAVLEAGSSLTLCGSPGCGKTHPAGYSLSHMLGGSCRIRVCRRGSGYCLFH